MEYFNKIVVIFVLLSWLTHLHPSSAGSNGDRYVRDACSVTQYPDLCIHSLASFSNTAKQSPSKWARAGVSVTISEAKKVAQYLMNLKKRRSMRGRNRVAISDCVECFLDTVDNLHKSLGVLRELNGQTFNTQMGDVTTWLSATLTDEDTCLEGFDGQKGEQVQLLQNRVSNVTYITSNALALVNKLATTGPESPTDP
uniref:Pectinesterase inhibitor domain-containing protein n=1 Tax=Davidia involucrata TaxID=16924 RepID=A0A5B7C1W9_DAVIN